MNQKNRMGPLVAACAALFLHGSCAPKRTLSLDELRLRYRETLVGKAPLDLADSAVASRIAQIDQLADKNWKTLNTASDRTWLWEDCNVEGKSPITLAPYNRLLQMTIAYSTDGSRFEGNEALRRDIISGLEWMYEHRYNPSIPLYDNWWMWVIGTPLSINKMIVLLYDELTEEQKTKSLEAMNYYAPNVTYEGASTGANKVWQCANMALRGILSRRGDLIRMAVDGLDTEFKTVTAGDGFYEDGSFVQHQWHPYTGGYGRSLLDQLSEMVNMVHGSEWEVPRLDMEMLYGWVRNAYEPLLYRGAMMDMVRGREIARPGTDDRRAGHSILLSLLRLSRSAPAAEKQYLESLVKQHALADHYLDLISVIPLDMVSDYRRLMADPNIKPAPAAARHKQFSMMDRGVHTTPAFGFAVSMSSARIENYETINEENLKGWYVGDGMTYLYDNDLRQYSDNFWPTVDPYRMAGTTVDTRTREAKTLPLAPGLLYADGYKSPRHWVGGSSIDGIYGICGMWLDAFESTLEAKKTWFMVGDEIVALGAGINSMDNRTIETTVENRKLNAGARYVLTLDGASVLAENGRHSAPRTGWAHFAGVDEQTAVGYYFPEPTGLNLLREDRTGSWADIDSFGIYKNTDPVTKSFFTLWLDHGRNPAKAAYAYVLLPGKSAEQVREYAAGPNMKVLSNTPQVQAVQATRERVIGLNFWEVPSAPVTGVRVSAPASVIMRETPEELLIGVSDPTQLYQDEIVVELDKNVAGARVENPNVQVLSMSPLKLRVRVRGGQGRTFAVTLRK